MASLLHGLATVLLVPVCVALAVFHYLRNRK